jgi:gliding motility-associated-like protein
MRFRFVPLLLLTVLLQTALHGQKRYNVWAFGEQSGLDFNSAPPMFFGPTQVSASLLNYTSSICDTAGNLLMYTDGLEIWNRKHEKMKKLGVQWPWGGYAVPLICPYPGNDSLYYLFAVSDNLHLLRYLTINSKANDGWGEVVYPPPPIPFNYATTLLNEASVMVAGTGHCNKKDYWIVAHSGNTLYSYPVSANGVDSPIVSRIDPSVLAAPTYETGNLKFAANGEKLIFPAFNENKILVFDFNNRTGLFSNPLALYAPDGTALEEAEISPDGSKLYISASFVREANNPFRFVSHLVYQMDLNAGTAAAIQRSTTELTPYADQSGCTPRTCFSVIRTMQTGPDGRIYVSYRSNETDANVIREPNLAGFKADYALFDINLKTPYTKFNYNYIRSESFEPARNSIIVKKQNCANEPVAFSLLHKNIDSVKWDFGDPGSGTRNYSTQATPNHTYPAPGTYQVTAFIYHLCFTDTARTTVAISNDATVKLPDWIGDTTLCLGFDEVWDVTTPGATSYLWSDGITNRPQNRIKVSGVYSVKAYNACSMDIRRFAVQFDACDCEVFVPSAFTPNNNGLNDDFKPLTTCFLKEYRFAIYNRYGGVVFSTTDRLRGWDGRAKDLQPGTNTYIWTLQYKDPNTKKLVQKKGTVTMIL